MKRALSFEDCTTLMIPGWNGSEEAHWQSIWERKYQEMVRVQQPDWRRPRRSEWVRQLGKTLESADKPVVLVAHSLGCLTVAAWVEQNLQAAAQIDCALLVAPPDLEHVLPGAEPLRAFGPTPRGPLPFRALLVGSENDPYMSSDAAESLAKDWRCEFVNAGAVGHINCASGFGEWLQGERYLARLRTNKADLAA